MLLQLPMQQLLIVPPPEDSVSSIGTSVQLISNLTNSAKLYISVDPMSIKFVINLKRLRQPSGCVKFLMSTFNSCDRRRSTFGNGKSHYSRRRIALGSTCQAKMESRTRATFLCTVCQPVDPSVTLAFRVY